MAQNLVQEIVQKMVQKIVQRSKGPMVQSIFYPMPMRVGDACKDAIVFFIPP